MNLTKENQSFSLMTRSDRAETVYSVSILDFKLCPYLICFRYIWLQFWFLVASKHLTLSTLKAFFNTFYFLLWTTFHHSENPGLCRFHVTTKVTLNFSPIYAQVLKFACQVKINDFCPSLYFTLLHNAMPVFKEEERAPSYAEFL